MAELRKYGVETRIYFPLIDFGTTDYEAGVTIAAGDATISKDGGAFASVVGETDDDLFVDEGGGLYSLKVAVAELQCATAVVRIVDQTSPKEWEDQMVLIDTYGNASAQHAFDLDTATQDVNVVSEDNIDFGATKKASITTACDTSCDTVTVTSMAVDVLTASALKADAVTEIQSGLSTVTTAQLATALTDIHLDHLFAAEYDPEAKPGYATALLNSMVEVSAGTGDTVFTLKALSKTPLITGFATSAKQNTMETTLNDVPTTAEFNARTLLAADYVVVGDTIAGVTTVGSVTGAVGSVTGAVGSVAGNVDGSVASVTDKAGFSLAADQSAVTIGTVSLVTECTTNTDMLTAAAVNAEVVDAIGTDTIAEMAQGAPSATPTLKSAINYLYRLFRNKTETTATAISVYDDAGTTVLFTATCSDDYTTFTKSEYVSG